MAHAVLLAQLLTMTRMSIQQCRMCLAAPFPVGPILTLLRGCITASGPDPKHWVTAGKPAGAASDEDAPF